MSANKFCCISESGLTGSTGSTAVARRCVTPTRTAHTGVETKQIMLIRISQDKKKLKAKKNFKEELTLQA